MICPNCNNENPDEAVFCKHCGNKLNQNIICPVCQKECGEYMQYCPACGTALHGAPPVAAVKTEDKGKAEKTKKALHLASGIVMMVAVLFALVFAFFIGTFQRADGVPSETLTIWHFFGRAYTLLDSTSAGQSAYTVAAHYIPVVLSTVVAAGTLVCVVVFSLLSAVKFGLHFKSENVHYYKYAVAAVFSFLLGATLFDCIHSASTDSAYGELSGTTVTGMVFTCLLIIASLSVKVAAIGKDFKKKPVLVDCLLTLAGILCLAFLSGFAKADQAIYTVENYYRYTYSIGFFRVNNELSFFSVRTNVAAPFTLFICASAAQIALIILAFTALILHIGNFTKKRTFSFGISIALAVAGALYLVLSVTAVEVFNGVATTLPQLRISAYPILAFIASVLYLAASITNKALGAREAKEKEAEETAQD